MKTLNHSFSLRFVWFLTLVPFLAIAESASFEPLKAGLQQWHDKLWKENTAQWWLLNSGDLAVEQFGPNWNKDPQSIESFLAYLREAIKILMNYQVQVHPSYETFNVELEKVRRREEWKTESYPGWVNLSRASLDTTHVKNPVLIAKIERLRSILSSIYAGRGGSSYAAQAALEQMQKTETRWIDILDDLRKRNADAAAASRTTMNLTKNNQSLSRIAYSIFIFFGLLLLSLAIWLRTKRRN